MPIDVDVASEVENYAWTFERAQAEAHDVLVEDYLPPLEHPAYHDIAIELLRIDLELSWQRKQPRSLEEYCRRFPELLEQSDYLERLAFEDYRQRCEGGAPVASREYAQRYAVDVASWPVLERSTPQRSSANPNRLSNGTVPTFPVAGERFLEFELVEELGRGSFARVFLARQTFLASRQVVLKISPGRSCEPDRLAELQHSNIVPIYSVHQDQGLEAVCMPFLGRATLADVLSLSRQGDTLPRSGQELLSTIEAACGRTTATTGIDSVSHQTGAEQNSQLAPSIRELLERSNYVNGVIWTVARLADGLAHAHERGILHRDLKPANILVSDDGRPMILDFNLAERISPMAGASAAVGGTLPYMSPEHLESLLDGVGGDVRSDVYSLGVILFELLSGQLPFPPIEDVSPRSIAKAVAQRRRGSCSVRRLNPQTSPSVAAIVARCLAPNPSERYQTANQLREDLDRHLEDRPLAHVRVGSPKERLQKWIRRHPRISSATGIAVLAGVAATALSVAWLLREARLQRLEAEQLFRHFTQEIQVARIPLALPDSALESHVQGSDATRALLSRYGVLSRGQWVASPQYASLEARQQEELTDEIARTLCLLTGSSIRQAAAETAPDQRLRMLTLAEFYNEKVSELSRQGLPLFTAAVGRQRRLIEQLRQSNDEHLNVRLDVERSRFDDRELAAVQLLQAGRYSEAILQLCAWRDEAPMDVSAWMLLGIAQAGIGAPAEAESCFTTCARLRPQLALCYFQRGLARHQQGFHEKAIHDFDIYLDMRGPKASALINRALSYRAIGQIQAALKDLDSAISLDGCPSRAYFIRAAVRRQLHDATGADEDFQRGMSLTPTDAASWLARGMAQLRQSPELALDDFQRARELEPGNRAAAQNMLHVLADRLHRDEEALSLLDELIVANPQDARALGARAVLSARGTDVERAVRDIEATIAIDNSPKMLLQAACVYAQASRADGQFREKAYEMMARSLGAQPDLAAAARRDPDLRPIRGTQRLTRILEAAEIISSGGEPPETPGAEL